MKITKEKREAFQPITIVIETRAEADLLWHKLNCSPVNSFADYCNKPRHGYNEDRDLAQEMFETLNSFHNDDNDRS